MIMKSALFILALTFSTSAVFANDTQCDVGFSCERTSNGQNILRETTVVLDESLEVCQTVTLANFGSDLKACTETAKNLNSK
jgi:hypothetical protein